MRNVKVLDVEKAFLPQGLDEELGEFLLSLRSTILEKVESDKLGPVEIFSCFWDEGVRTCKNSWSTLGNDRG